MVISVIFDSKFENYMQKMLKRIQGGLTKNCTKLKTSQIVHFGQFSSKNAKFSLKRQKFISRRDLKSTINSEKCYLQRKLLFWAKMIKFFDLNDFDRNSYILGFKFKFNVWTESKMRLILKRHIILLILIIYGKHS